ncbi:Alpha-N-acetylneuraminide alpha-2,8-sialyltransferase [Saguinus oedipus]|uniref:Alpha-N-acetylneuraminide alpha-2,8-sialyltransferase n=1 Tax=Saguinus oedipus TaxID=9490 RepID=A0ABQ9UYC0_SAGOE|nr:Alpha-N-acetylneuraminide alpha-2,8-sialyltransferase [Saguinus oedipus]
MGASALCVVVLCWLYIFPVYRLPNEKEIVQGVLQQGTAWRRNQTAARAFSIDCGTQKLAKDITSSNAFL